jgi:hypothetical protein
MNKELVLSKNQAMKRASGSKNIKKGKKKEEATTSRLRKNKQTKLIVKQEVVTSESDPTDYIMINQKKNMLKQQN